MDVDWGDVPAWAGVAVSLGLSGAALVVSLFSRRDSRRSADAAERSAMAAERHIALAEEEASRPPWKVERVPGTKSRYLLINAGTEPAHDVEISADFVFDSPLREEVVEGGDSIAFLAAQDGDTRDTHMTVSWRPARGDERRTWRRAF